MIFGVPEGCCLGLLQFIAYVTDIDNQIKEHANDSKIYKSFLCYSHLSKQEVQSDLNSLTSWSQDWQLKI